MIWKNGTRCEEAPVEAMMMERVTPPNITDVRRRLGIIVEKLLPMIKAQKQAPGTDAIA